MADNAAEDGSVEGEVVADVEGIASELFGVLKDARKVRVVLERAEGKSWKQCAAAANVDVDTVIIWRHRHPIDDLVARLILRAAKSPILRLIARMERAADVVCDHMDGTFEATTISVTKAGNEITVVDYDAERLKAGAAKTALGFATKILEYADKLGDDPDSKPGGKAREWTTAELLERAREMRRLQKGG